MDAIPSTEAIAAQRHFLDRVKVDIDELNN